MINLQSIQQPEGIAPPRILIYGPEGIGKTSWAVSAPKPIVIFTEEGRGALRVPHFPLARSFQDVLDMIAVLYSDPHDYQTVVLDSLDWLESLIWVHVARSGGHASIEGFGYGKGYQYAVDRLRDILEGLDALRNQRQMMVVLTAHSQVRRFDDPTSEPYDRFSLKLDKKAAPVVTEWVDVLGFAAQEMIIKREDVGFNKKAARALSVGGRVLYLSRCPAFDAKTRYPMPDVIPLKWEAFATALQQSTSAAEQSISIAPVIQLEQGE